MNDDDAATPKTSSATTYITSNDYKSRNKS